MSVRRIFLVASVLVLGVGACGDGGSGDVAELESRIRQLESDLAAAEPSPTTQAPSTTVAASTTTRPMTTTTKAGTISRSDYDLTIKQGSCRRDAFTNHFEGTIKNTTSATKSYWITVIFENAAGVRVDDGFAIINSLAPGQTAVWEAVGFGGSFSGGRCRVQDVDVYNY